MASGKTQATSHLVWRCVHHAMVQLRIYTGDTRIGKQSSAVSW